MRVGSLSDADVIRVITKYFVPVWISRDHYQLEKPSFLEAAELLRIDKERAAKKMPGGGVSVMILGTNGDVLASQRVHDACKAKDLLPILNKIVQSEKPKARELAKLKKKAHRVVQTKVANDSVLLRVWTRFEGTRKKTGVTEDWVELYAKEWKSLIPEEDALPGAKWEVSEKAIEKLYKCFYPPSPNWRKGEGTLELGKLSAKLTRKGEDDWQIDLIGKVRLKHPFGGTNTPGWIVADLVGVAHYNPKEEKLVSVQIISKEATHTWQWKGKDLPEAMTIAVEQHHDEEK